MSGADASTLQAREGRSRIDVASSVDRAHLEAVRAARPDRCRPSASCTPPKPSRPGDTQTSSPTQTKRTTSSPPSRTSCPSDPPKSTCPARWCHPARSRSRRVTRRSRRCCRPRPWRGRRTCACPRRGRCRPSASCRARRPPRRCGTRRSKPASLEEKPMLAVVAAVEPEGPSVMVGVGRCGVRRAHRPRARGSAGVGVPGQVGGSDVEGVRPGSQARVRLG